MAHAAQYDGEIEKRGPKTRQHVDVSWAACKFFLLSFYFNLLAVSLHVCEMAHTVLYEVGLEKEKRGQMYVPICIMYFTSRKYYYYMLLFRLLLSYVMGQLLIL